MGDGSAAEEDRRLRTLVVAVPLTEAHQARLRTRFPDIEIIQTTEERLSEALAAADAVLAWELTAEQVAAAPRLRWFHRAGAGVDRIALAALEQRGVHVTNARGVHGPNIGEHVLAMMLAFARQLPALVRSQTAHKWQAAETRDRIFELHGQTLLIVGLGALGRGVATRAAAFGMEIIATRRRLDLPVPEDVRDIVPLPRLPEALGRAHHVVICLPLTPRTHNLFDATMLGHLRPDAYLYNVGRGPIVDTAALIAALQAGRLAGAGLDVTDPEPLPPNSPLWAMDNVLITAHTAGSTPRYWDRGIRILELNIIRFLAGEPLLNVVDLQEGY